MKQILFLYLIIFNLILVQNSFAITNNSTTNTTSSMSSLNKEIEEEYSEEVIGEYEDIELDECDEYTRMVQESLLDILEVLLW